jgi:hypothetical protein
MTKALIYTDVFVPGGYPNYTYNPRTALNLETRVSAVRENLCKLVVVTGHTKSGKTVLVRKVLPREDTLWIDGGSVGSEDDFWMAIVDQLNLFQATEIQTSNNTTTGIGGEASVQAGLLVAKAEGKITASVDENQGSSSTQSREISSKILALKNLREQKLPLIVDDFHYLPREIQGSVVRALKPLIFDGLPVVFIAIPHRRYDAVKVEKEMTGRMFPISIPLWEGEELEFIPRTGFHLLGATLNNDAIDLLAKESIGSPHLIQEFCRELCKIHPLNPGETQLKLTMEEIEKAFAETAEAIGRPIFEKLARGPRQRSDRIPRKLKTGQEVDIYELVLHALAHIKPGLVTLEYEGLRSAIKDICEPESVPQLQEVARVLKYMSEIAATDQSSTPVIDFDEEAKVLRITDPFFAFYLRWGNLTR